MTKIPFRSLFTKRYRLRLLVITAVIIVSLILLITLIKKSGDPVSEIEASPALTIPAVSLFLKTVIIISLLTSMTSLILLLFILLKKRIQVGDEVFLIPDEMAKNIVALEHRTYQMSNGINSSNKKIESRDTEMNNAIQDIKSILNKFFVKIDEKDEEIKKYKDGYDAYLYEKFLLRFIRIDEYLSKIYKSEHVDLKDIKQLKTLMEYALDGCGVELFEPKVGADYKDAKGVADNPEIVKTEDEKEDFLIKEVIQPGYRLNNGLTQKDISLAKVTIYRYGNV